MSGISVIYPTGLDKKLNIPKNINEVTQMRNRNFAIEYLNSTVNKKLTKTDFCRSKNISRNSLNMGLNSVGIKIACKTRTNENKQEQSGTKENKSEQLGTKEKKKKIFYKQMTIVKTEIMKQNWNKQWLSIFQIAFSTSNSSIFSSVVIMIYYFWVFYRKHIFTKITNFCFFIFF
jgi:cation transport ATPase